MQYKPEEIGKIIKMERERKHWTQIRLSKEVGVTSKQISVYENGGTTPPIDMLFKFCEIFDCELGYILGEKQYKEKTRVNTILADELGLTAKSISNLTSVTSVGELNEPQFGDFYYWDFIRNREVINKLFSSEHFKSFIIALADLENVKSSLNNSELQIWSALKDKIGEEGFEKAKYNSVYIHQVDCDGSSVEDINRAIKYIKMQFDHIPDENAESNLTDDEIKEALEYLKIQEKCIELHRDAEYKVKVCKYDINRIFIKMLDDMYQ